MIKAIAIDDEPLAIAVIDVFCKSLPNISLEKTFLNLSNAKKYLNKFPVDVIFLDIEMPKINGIDFYKSLDKKINVVFTTAYEHYAVEGFNLNATDYLLKPFSIERFTETVKRIEENKFNLKENSEKNTYLSIRADYKLHRISYDTILYIQAMNDYIKIYTEDDKSIVARSSMKKVLEQLPCNKFIRIHKSFIIPIPNIQNIGNTEISLGYITLPIGNSYKKALEKTI